MTPVEKIVSCLEGVRETEGGFMAKCPAHDDRQASLSISEGNEGRVVLHCHAGCEPEAVVTGMGLEMRDLFPEEPARKPVRKIVAEYDYKDEQGALLFQGIRFEPKGFRQRQPDGKGGWTWNLQGVRLVLYRLPEVVAAVGKRRVFVVEGEKDADALARLGFVATCNPMGAGKWREAYSETLRGGEVVILPDNDTPGRKHAREVARSLYAHGCRVWVVELPDVPEKGDVTDWLRRGGTAERLKQIVTDAPAWEPEDEAEPDTEADEREEKEERKTQAQILIEIGETCRLFHTSEREAYATVSAPPSTDGGTGHSETHALRSKTFRTWLTGRFYDSERKPPGSQALQDALSVLEAKAIYEGAERPVFVRVAEHEGAIYVDLCNEAWEAVRITPATWETVSDAPVAFRRTRAMLPLPRPERPGNLNLLREHMGLDEERFALLCAFLVQCFRPSGPYPLLAWVGEQGTGKSTRSRQIRSLVDPSSVPVRTQPRNEHDLVIAAHNGWLLAFDNLSGVPPWLSDALCRLSTGGGFGTRELYSNGEEALFFALRAVLLNGIEDLATRPDLADRTVTITLEPIAPEARRPEREIMEAFERDRPAMLGGIFDAVSAALRRVDAVEIPGLPRMADFAKWAVAAEAALPVPEGAFMQAYEGSRREAVETAVESDTVASAVRSMLQDATAWQGTTSELLEALRPFLPNPDKPPRGFPKSAQAMTARLRRVAPSLRAVGIERRDVARSGKSGSRVFALERRCKSTSDTSVTSEAAKAERKRGFSTDVPTDVLPAGTSGTSAARQNQIGPNSPEKGDTDVTDKTDEVLQTYSNGGDGVPIEFDFIEDEEAPF